MILAEEFTRAGVPTGWPQRRVRHPDARQHAARCGGPRSRSSYYLPRILSGADTWCQGYSEPNAGSDLGNLGLRAELDGDEWVLNGQKIWTSAGHLADHIFTLARTDPDAPKHKGISFLLVPMDQPGIEVRPIKMISGESEFNEVFYTDARCPKENVRRRRQQRLGVWRCRCSASSGARRRRPAPIRYQGEFDRLVALAGEYGVADDPVIRQRLAWCYSKVQIMKFLGQRTLTQVPRRPPSRPRRCDLQAVLERVPPQVTELGVDIIGADALVTEGRPPSSAFQTDDPGAPNSSASWVGTFLNARAGTIYAGSSQIQRNIIGEMMLGLPKEPRPTSWTGRGRYDPAECRRRGPVGTSAAPDAVGDGAAAGASVSRRPGGGGGRPFLPLPAR